MTAGTPEPPASADSGLVFDDPLAQLPDAEDVGWGDERRGSGTDLDRFLDEKPPHHL